MYELLETSRTPPYGYLATGASNIGLQPPPPSINTRWQCCNLWQWQSWADAHTISKFNVQSFIAPIYGYA